MGLDNGHDEFGHNYSMPDKMKIVEMRNEEDMKNIGIKIKLVR